MGPRRSLRVSASSSTRTKSTLTLHHNSAITSPTWASEASPDVGDEKAAGTLALKRKENVRISDKMQTTVASRGTNFLQIMAAKPSRKRRDSVWPESIVEVNMQLIGLIAESTFLCEQSCTTSRFFVAGSVHELLRGFLGASSRQQKHNPGLEQCRHQAWYGSHYACQI